jgi:hypothetical protein
MAGSADAHRLSDGLDLWSLPGHGPEGRIANTANTKG